MTANEVDGAIASSKTETGPKLLALVEDQWFDRKSARSSPKDLAPALIAFANAEGGVIVVGLHNGKVEGLTAQGSRINDLRQTPFDVTSPPVRCSFEQIDCVNQLGQDDFLLVIRIDPSESVHETTAGDCYLRVGDESRKLNFAQRQELLFDKGQAQYDGQPATTGLRIADLDRDLLDNYREKVGATSTVSNLLKARSLITQKGELTVGGYLLFANRPQDKFPEAYVRVLRFLSNERGTGSRLSVEEGSDYRIEGPLPRVVQEAQRVIESLIPRRRSLSDSGSFQGGPIVPRDAWLEGLVNAVIHRSYSLAGDHIRVEIYPNRVEIESPGRFPGLANPAKPLEISRFARNPRIARVCADLRIGQELGEGIKRIYEEMRRVGLTDPVYQQTAGSVKLSLAAMPRLDRRVAQRLPGGSQQVLDAMRGASENLGTGALAQRLGWSRPALLTRLRALQEEGLVQWVGKAAKDPRAAWVLTDR